MFNKTAVFAVLTLKNEISQNSQPNGIEIKSQTSFRKYKTKHQRTLDSSSLIIEDTDKVDFAKPRNNRESPPTHIRNTMNLITTKD